MSTRHIPHGSIHDEENILAEAEKRNKRPEIVALHARKRAEREAQALLLEAAAEGLE